MGRPSKPVDLILLEGNKDRRTKAELEYRKKAEEALYTGENFKEEKFVKENPIAHKEFLRLRRLYSKISFVDALDQQMINRYCLEVANLSNLQKLYEKLESKIDDCEQLETKDIVQLYKSITGVLSNMHKSKELLLKYEDRLFLNPTSRIRSIPKKPPEEEKPSGMAAFMNKRK